MAGNRPSLSESNPLHALIWYIKVVLSRIILSACWSQDPKKRPSAREVMAALHRLKTPWNPKTNYTTPTTNDRADLMIEVPRLFFFWN